MYRNLLARRVWYDQVAAGARRGQLRHFAPCSSFPTQWEVAAPVSKAHQGEQTVICVASAAANNAPTIVARCKLQASGSFTRVPAWSCNVCRDSLCPSWPARHSKKRRSYGAGRAREQRAIALSQSFPHAKIIQLGRASDAE